MIDYVLTLNAGDAIVAAKIIDPDKVGDCSPDAMRRAAVLLRSAAYRSTQTAARLEAIARDKEATS